MDRYWRGAPPSHLSQALQLQATSRQNNHPNSSTLDNHLDLPDIPYEPAFPSHDDSSTPSLVSSSEITTPESETGWQPTMPTAIPINIATPSSRNSSSSPVTSHGQKNPKFLDPSEADSRTSAMMSGTGYDNSMGMGGVGVQDSFAGAKPIYMNNANRQPDNRNRRESLAGSAKGGMSWGGISVGSWIRDDVMVGTSPFPYQSPSYHSSSYMPKLEAQFMKDFACCGKKLASLHDLLAHYEEHHAKEGGTPLQNQASYRNTPSQRTRENSTPNNKAALAALTSSQVQQQNQQQHSQMSQSGAVGGIQLLRQQQQSQSAQSAQNSGQPDEMEGVEDMEMDDAMESMDQSSGNLSQQSQQAVRGAQQSQFGQQPRPQLSVNASGMQYPGLRTSQPTTPATSGFGFQHNPTVSSVNTPTLSTHSTQQQPTFSPNVSIPGTPAGDMEDDFPTFPTGGMANSTFSFGYGNRDMGLDLCIDNPAKQLYSPNGGNRISADQRQFATYGLGGGQYINNDFMRALQQQGMMGMDGLNMNGMTVNLNGMGMGMGMEEHKPFKCPVIGCEKAYKNQNGLKYHKQHGHSTQQLHENADGTFSIVNPETSTPYLGEAGMAKEKPYRCDHCGKRYKNLNGLKYHRQHSPACNPELKLEKHLQVNGYQAMTMNPTMAMTGFPGLPGIGEEQQQQHMQ